MATFSVGAVMMTTDIGFDFALLQDYLHQKLALEECQDWNEEHKNYTVYMQCQQKHSNYPKIFLRTPMSTNLKSNYQNMFLGSFHNFIKFGLHFDFLKFVL